MHQTNAWLKSLMGRIGTGDRHRAYAALRVTLHALRDRLPPEVAVHLRERHKEEFLAPIAVAFRGEPEIRPEEVAKGVFALLATELDAGEIRKVVSVPPRELRELWPAEARG